ncbi:MAG: hypothetical protein KDA93_01770 [Planctomycetaceae bacterium]|nr:hypothetical protein [Planctomycetaceae bacterium]
MFQPKSNPKNDASWSYDARRGAFVVLALFCLLPVIAFVSFSIDTGHVALSKTIQQNAVDAAALAAAMEITNAVENAPPGEADPTAYAREQAKVMAVDVAALNGVFVDPNLDVTFGLRSYNPATEQFEITWGVEPANAVKVRARRDNADTSAPDGKLPLMFAAVFGDDAVDMKSEAIAYIESRDIAVVLDFSGSMAYDSLFRSDSVSNLGVDSIRQNLEDSYLAMFMADGALGTLDHVDPDNSASDITGAAKWLTVHGNPPNNDDPQIDVTFMYDQVFVESDTAFKKVELQFGNSWYTINGLNTTSGTYSGSGGYSGDDIDGVKVFVVTDENEPVVQTGDLEDGYGSTPTASVTVDHETRSVTVSLSTNSLDRIKIWYTDGSVDNWYNASGSSYTVTGDYGKTVRDVKVYANSNWDKKFDGFDQGNGYTETFYDDNNAVKTYFALNGVSWPFNNGSWDSYINYVRSDSDINRGGLREMYGGSTLVHYLLETYPKHSQTPQLSRTMHYPFHAVRKGNELFVDFLQDLGFGDHVGLVSYDQERRTESILNESGQSVDISADPLDSNYDAIKTIMDYKQASNYYPYTNIGGGIRQAIDMIEDYSRDGSRPTILVMTDGNANTYDNEAGYNSRQGSYSDDGYWDVPSDFDWSVFNNLTTTSSVPFYVNDNGSDNKARRYALSQAFKAAEEGYTLHTLAVGAGADTDLMKAIAFIGGGEFIEVQGTLTVADLQQQVEAGFYRIAALVPPAKLADPEVAE